ncbi:Hypothetical protein NTJ_04140 [Nesidiocoris tenuis]|uniref:Uncharacterized protein n=1 Tax=Nesidiocoris tenuis TaxID=355587 RepID=A0ABN7AGE1_9HEMI|nr:Hypothetical protein NTJ_04140 [Nesidiocoris tenuis]
MELENVWNKLTSDLPSTKEEWWTKILTSLNDPKRKCHNYSYLAQKISLYETIKHLLKNREAVEYALFFSYIEYGPMTVDGNEKNIAHFKQFATECGIPLESDLVRDTLVLLECNSSCMTEEHIKEGAFGSEDKHYFLDLDMAVLGMDDVTYNQYWQSEKEENDVVPESMYNTFRTKILKTFLQIPNIYATKEFREKYEENARRNLQRDVSCLD